MTRSCLTIIGLLAVAAFAADAPKITVPLPLPLEAADKLQIRDAQLTLAQAHISRLQAESAVAEAENQIKQIVQSLKVKYSCPDCTLNADLTWTPAKPEPTATPAPEKGATQSKEKQ